MNHIPYDAVLFDLDGTLCNSEKGIVTSMQYAMDRLGQKIPEGMNFHAVIGPPLYDTFVNIFGLTPELARKAMVLYREHFDREGMYMYTVYPHIRSILQILKKGGVYTAMATSKPTKTAHAVLKHFGLTHYFDKMVGVDDDDHVSDKTELVRRALPKKFRRAAMVGDRSYDMLGAVANHIDGIGAGYGYGTDTELREAGAEHIAEDTVALRALLCQGADVPRGFFLTVEGPDGSGKSTQVDLLEKNLCEYGFSVLRTREPGGCKISEDIRRIILDTGNMEMSAACEALLYAAARAQHVHQVIRPAVEQGMLVLCDRFVDSSIVYQGSGRRLGMEAVQQINAPAVADMEPDATLYLAIDHKAALDRRLSATTPDRLELEAPDFYERVQKAYEKLIHDHKHRFLIVNADQAIEKVAKDTLSVVLSRLEPEMKQED